MLQCIPAAHDQLSQVDEQLERTHREYKFSEQERQHCQTQAATIRWHAFIWQQLAHVMVAFSWRLTTAC